MSTPDELRKSIQPDSWRPLYAFRKPSVAPGTPADRSPAVAHDDAFKQRFDRLRTHLLHGIKQFLPDSVFLFFSHRRRVGRFPRLLKPQTFNEIILDRCLHPDPVWTILADKLAVRDYVKARVGEQYLVPLIAVPEVFTRQVFDALPTAFVMKANHGCAFVKVVRNKADESFEELKKLADQWLATDFYLASRERHYRAIKPRLYFEKLLVEQSGKIPDDFKMNIFGDVNGVPNILTGVVSDRFGSPRHDFYDTGWNRLNIALGDYPCSTVAAPRLPNWDELVRVASRLSEGLGYVRVDLYACDGQIFFGELTFTPGAGVSPLPERYDREWGRLIREMPAATPAG